MFTRLQGQTLVGFTIMDKRTLGPKIRQGIREGLLPTQRPSRTWFGFAQGDTSCAACGQSVAIRELECEAGFPGEPRTYLFHAACFEAWQTERVHATCAARSNGDGAARAGAAVVAPKSRPGVPTSGLVVPTSHPNGGVDRAPWPMR